MKHVARSFGNQVTLGGLDLVLWIGGLDLVVWIGGLDWCFGLVAWNWFGIGFAPLVFVEG